MARGPSLIGAGKVPAEIFFVNRCAFVSGAADDFRKAYECLNFFHCIFGIWLENPDQTGKQWKNNFKKVKSGLSIF